MKNMPYIGVTGFMSREEVDEVLKAVPQNSKRKLMVGVLVSQKTMEGIPNKWPGRYPKFDEFAEIFSDDPRVLNLVHFNTKEMYQDKFLEQLIKVTEKAGKNFHGFQLNVAWPDMLALCEYKILYPKKILVLQCGGKAMEQAGSNSREVADWMGLYDNGDCEYTLIDPSGGLGIPFDSTMAMEYLTEFTDKLKKMSFGIAGGLNHLNLAERLSPIIKTFPDISIDAEGGLRDEDDKLDIEKAKAYVAKAYELFGD